MSRSNCLDVERSSLEISAFAADGVCCLECFTVISFLSDPVYPHRYTAGQRFGQHIDESVELGGRLATEYTLLIYLTGGEESSTEGKASREELLGGETVFYNRRRVVAEVTRPFLLMGLREWPVLLLQRFVYYPNSDMRCCRRD